MAKGKDEVLSRITIEHYDKRYIVEYPYSDTPDIENIIDMTYAILLMMGYHQDTINQALVETAEMKGYNNDKGNDND